MSKSQFDRLVGILKRNDPGWTNPQRTIRVEDALAMTLRYLGGGRRQDASDLHGVHDKSEGRILWRVIETLEAAPELDDSFPLNNKPELDKITKKFQQKSILGIFAGVCGALDGISIKIQRPSPDDVAHPNDYYSGKKGFHALNVQAIASVLPSSMAHK